MSDERRDYGPTGCVNRSFGLLTALAGLLWIGRRVARGWWRS